MTWENEQEEQVLDNGLLKNIRMKKKEKMMDYSLAKMQQPRKEEQS
jgi:hypothetical protein